MQTQWLQVIQERYSSSLKKVIKVVDARPGEIMFGLNMIVNKGKTVFIADTTVHEYPTKTNGRDCNICCGG